MSAMHSKGELYPLLVSLGIKAELTHDGNFFFVAANTGHLNSLTLPDPISLKKKKKPVPPGEDNDKLHALQPEPS